MQKRNRNVLIVCNTLAQFIIASQINESILHEDSVDIILTDQTKQLANIYSQLRIKGNHFSRVMFIRTKDLCVIRNCAELLSGIFHSIIPDKRFSVVSESVYDELIFHNIDVAIMSLIDLLEKNNRDLVISQYEEGIFSYNHDYNYGYMNIIRRLRKGINKDDPCSSNAGYYYCFYPDAYMGKLEKVAIPQIEKGTVCIETLKTLFDIDDDKLHYKEKYIYFASACEADGGKKIGEVDLVKSIANLVDMTNVVVKPHPRDTYNDYSKLGIRIDKNSDIPWEIIQLLGDFTDKIFLTLNSNSVLSARFMGANAVRTYFLYKLCDVEGNDVATSSIERISSFLSMKQMEFLHDTVSVPDKLEDILDEQ